MQMHITVYYRMYRAPRWKEKGTLFYIHRNTRVKSIIEHKLTMANERAWPGKSGPTQSKL